MARYRVQYEDGSHTLIKRPECNSNDTNHDDQHHLNMNCTTCKLRFKIHETDKKILQITTEKDTEPPPQSSQGQRSRLKGNTKKPPDACGKRRSNTKDVPGRVPPEHT